MQCIWCVWWDLWSIVLLFIWEDCYFVAISYVLCSSIVMFSFCIYDLEILYLSSSFYSCFLSAEVCLSIPCYRVYIHDEGALWSCAYCDMILTCCTSAVSSSKLLVLTSSHICVQPPACCVKCTSNIACNHPKMNLPWYPCLLIFVHSYGTDLMLGSSYAVWCRCVSATCWCTSKDILLAERS